MIMQARPRRYMLLYTVRTRVSVGSLDGDLTFAALLPCGLSSNTAERADWAVVQHCSAPPAESRFRVSNC